MEVTSKNFLTIQGWMRTELDLSGSELLMYALIYGFAQEEQQWCTCSLNYMTYWLGLSNKQRTREVLQRLIDKGLVLKQEYYVNNVKFCKYRTNSHAVAERATPPVAERATNNNSIDIDTLDKDKSLSLFNSSNEESNAVDTHARKVSYKWLIDYWNEHAAPKGYSKLTRIDGKRLTATRARLKEYGADAFKQAIDKACASDFLRGQNKSGFTLTFDWMIKPTNFPKVLEGNYDNPQTTPTTPTTPTINDTDNHNTGHPSEQNNSEGVVQEPFIIIDEERMRLWETKRILVP